ncbi:MAG: S41 family peptidase [Prevotellaceae bacterium]|nr:S41 family peptidase [Prevotellaceae bacterium]
MNRNVIVSCIIVSLVSLVACVDEDEFRNTPEGNFEALWSIIDQRYCFLDYKQETLGVDWDEVHGRYRQRISGTMNSDQLFEVLTDMLSELQDGHVNLYSAGNVARYWGWYEDYDKNLDEELRSQYLGTDYRIASGLYYRILPDNIGYVVCESFSTALGDGNVSDMLYYLRTCNGLILDVRGNSGGQLTNAELLASHFTNERILVGYSTYKTGPGHSDFATPVAEYLSPSEGVRWQKPVVVLTNRQCFSACNIFVRDIHECPLVTLLGDQTGGGSGMPFSTELPNGWAVRFSASPSYDAEMNQIEFGIQPDISCSLDSLSALQGIDTIIEEARALLAQ